MYIRGSVTRPQPHAVTVFSDTPAAQLQSVTAHSILNLYHFGFLLLRSVGHFELSVACPTTVAFLKQNISLERLPTWVLTTTRSFFELQSVFRQQPESYQRVTYVTARLT